MKIFFCLFILFLSFHCFGQYLENPSFEGTRGESNTPPNWTGCDITSTPDTQPETLIANTHGEPSDGSTFISLVSRGVTPSDNSNRCEDIAAKLITPLKKSNCYSFEIDLRKPTTMNWRERYFYTQSVILKIYGGISSCQEDKLLFQTNAVENTEWQTYQFFVQPNSSDIEYLKLRVEYTHLPEYFGGIFIDNMKITDAGKDTMMLDTTINYGETLQFNASEGGLYLWHPEDGLNCNNCQSPIAEPPNSILYTANITKGICSYNEGFKIKVLPIIPNTITPNNDGKNDYFQIQPLVGNMQLTITDRHGNRLYSNDNYDNSWEAFYNGSRLPAGTYWYSLIMPNNEGNYKGFIYVMY